MTRRYNQETDLYRESPKKDSFSHEMHIFNRILNSMARVFMLALKESVTIRNR